MQPRSLGTATTVYSLQCRRANSGHTLFKETSMSIATDVNTVTATGSSGAQYSFKVYPWDTPFKSIGGVYLVLRTGNPSFDLIYVGQTEDLNSRFDSHHKQPCFDRKGRTHIAVLVEPSEPKRLRIESDLVTKYQPSCNG